MFICGYVCCFLVLEVGVMLNSGWLILCKLDVWLSSWCTISVIVVLVVLILLGVSVW